LRRAQLFQVRGLLSGSPRVLVSSRQPTPNPPTQHRLKADGPYDSRLLPATLAICLVSALSVVFSGAVVRLHSET